MSERDSQRSRVYRWGWAVFPEASGEILGLDACRALVARVWGDYRGETADPPEVTDGRGSPRGRASRWEVHLPRFARRPSHILHELAHSLEPGGVAHGPEFARLLAELWVRYGGVPRRTVIAAARAQRVRLAPLAAIEGPISPRERVLRREVREARQRYEEARARLAEYQGRR